jgi:hypothetical protein
MGAVSIYWVISTNIIPTLRVDLDGVLAPLLRPANSPATMAIVREDNMVQASE